MNREAILQEIAEAHRQRNQRPFEFTRKEFMKETGLSYYGASRELKKLVASGELVCDHANVNGRDTLVYWRLRDEEAFTALDGSAITV